METGLPVFETGISLFGIVMIIVGAIIFLVIMTFIIVIIVIALRNGNNPNNMHDMGLRDRINQTMNFDPNTGQPLTQTLQTCGHCGMQRN